MEDVSKFLVGQTDEFAGAAERPSGTVSVPSGRLRIIDPLTDDLRGCVLWVPPGLHRTRITFVADDELGWLPAYLSVRFSDAQPSTVAFADFLVAPPVSMATGAITSAGSKMIALYDADAQIDREALSQSLFADLDVLSATPIGATNVVTDARAYVVACRAPVGRGLPILATRTAAGELTAIHIDFMVVDFDPGDDYY